MITLRPEDEKLSIEGRPLGKKKISLSKKQKKIYIHILAVEKRGILNRITGLSGTTDDFRPLIEELGDCRVTGVHSKGPLSIDNVKR